MILLWIFVKNGLLRITCKTYVDLLFPGPPGRASPSTSGRGAAGGPIFALLTGSVVHANGLDGMHPRTVSATGHLRSVARFTG